MPCSLTQRPLLARSGSSITPNAFVETTLSYALTYISRAARQRSSHSMKSARLTILADNDYYSQPSSTTSSSATTTSSSPSTSSSATTLTNTPRFARFPTTLAGANKTGLGSSAALVTALTAALLSHYLDRAVFDPTTAAGKRTLHNLAQAAHCAAQGKVGSGFDVAAAVYGSSTYRRFSPSVLAGLPAPGAAGFAHALQGVVDGPGWDAEAGQGAVRLPPGVAVRMCDVDCGSQTVGMVKKVLAWRAEDPDGSAALWDALQLRNEHLAGVLRAGDDLAALLPPAVAAVRELVRDMGRASGVPIEPESQTALLDGLSGLAGVFGGVVPGAGGYDALALVMRDDADTARRVEEFVETWAREKGGRVRLLPVKGEMEGVRNEDLGIYDGWLN